MVELKTVLTTGKRKTAVARVWLKPGRGNIVVNKRKMEEYFPRLTLQEMIKEPLAITNYLNKFDITANIAGGGVSAQAGALRHGIARGLVEIDESLRTILKKKGFLTRDPREKERKKYGQKGARKRFQYSKR